jgi:hypothetical protein
MTKKIIPLNSYIGASEAANLLSLKMGRWINPEYLTKLAKSKKQPIRTQQVSNRLLYNREDLEKVVIKQKRLKDV